MVWQAGQQLQEGKFEILEVLGRGGFGITYKARHRDLAAEVVIKTPDMLQKRDVEYEQYVEKFQAEGRKLAKFLATPHPHIVRVLDFFMEGQIPCLVMDFIQGQTLMEKVRAEGRLPEADCLRYIRQIGDALAAVHRAGIVHRDAHPGNIIIQPSGYAVLIDFGIAKDIIPASSSSTDYAANPSFAPYEQIYRGSKVDRQPSLDIYALAATFYYAVTGERPTPAMERRLDNRSLTPPKEINRQLSENISEAILRGMALEKGDRPQSMQDWLQQFDPSPPPVPPQYRKEAVAAPQSPPNNIKNPLPNDAPGKIPWVWLALAFISYSVSGYILASSSAPWWILARAGVWPWPFIFAGFILFAVISSGNNPPIWRILLGMVLGAWAGILGGIWAWIRVWAWIPIWTGARYEVIGVYFGSCFLMVAWTNFGIYSSGFHRFLIAAGTTLGGLGFGWFLEFVLKGYFK